jgi:hypothetical protein
MVKAYGVEMYYPFLEAIESGFYGGYSKEDIHIEMTGD